MKFFNSSFFTAYSAYSKQTVISVDCETTGLDPNKDEIINIAGVKIENCVIKYGSSMNIFIQPTSDMSAEAIKIHGIRPVDLENSTPVDVAMQKFYDWAGNSAMLGYNVGFDHQILNRYAKKFLKKKLQNPKVELLEIFKAHFPQNMTNPMMDLTLENIAYLMNTPLYGRHSALGDATSVGMLFISLLKKYR